MLGSSGVSMCAASGQPTVHRYARDGMSLIVPVLESAASLPRAGLDPWRGGRPSPSSSLWQLRGQSGILAGGALKSWL